MRFFDPRLAAIVAVLCALPASGRGEPAALEVYVPLGSSVRYRVVKAPVPARQLGAIAAAQLESSELPKVIGDAPAAPAANGSGAMPLAATPRSGSCKCKTRLGDDRRERIAEVHAETEFTVGAELSDIGLLELRARYHDGISVRINGREVVRRNLGPREPMVPAPRSRGPELETFFIPVTAGLLRRGKNNVAIEVRPSKHRLSPTLDFELRPRRGARIVRGPVLQRVTPSSALVTFETDLPTRSHVDWGATSELGKRAISAGGALAVRHRVQLSGLTPGKAVHYRAVAGASATAVRAFHPAPGRGQPVRFVVYGDMRGGHRVHGKILESIISEAPDFVLVTGDLVARGSDAGDWQKFFKVAGPLLARFPYYSVAGNHDVGKSGSEQRRMNEIFAMWPGPASRPPWGHWYSFDVGDVHIVMLDSNAYRHAAQLEWLGKDLAAARKRGVRAIFAATHDGPYSSGIHKGNRYAARHYAPLLAKHDVAMIFSGHDHLYQRGEVEGLRYMVSGGGGAPLYPVRCGVKGKRKCRVNAGTKHAVSAHHYIAVSVYPSFAQLCPRRPDRQPLERCVKIPLK